MPRSLRTGEMNLTKRLDAPELGCCRAFGKDIILAATMGQHTLESAFTGCA